MRGISTVSFCIGLAASAAWAQQPAQPDASQQFARSLQPGQRLADYLERHRAAFHMVDFDRDGNVTEADVDAHRNQTATAFRAGMIGDLLRRDLDGDGVVTREEAVQAETLKAKGALRGGAPLPSVEVVKVVDAAVAKLMQADLDGDGRIEWREMLEHAKRQPMPSQAAFPPMIARILSLDADGDRRTTVAEFEAAARRVFAAVDSDGNEILSQEEIDAYRARTGQQPLRVSPMQAEAQAKKAEAEAAVRKACAMPRPSDAAKVVLLSAYEADAVSTVTLGTQDVATGTAAIEIEPGDEPLYIVAASFRPVIWRLGGAVQRVERLVLAGTMTGPNSSKQDAPPLAGATGIAAERVTFLGRSGCIRYFTETPSGNAATAAGIVRRETGKEPALVRAQYEVSAFVVPSGQIRASGRKQPGGVLIIQQNEGTLAVQGDPRGIVVRTGPGNLGADLLRFNPGGIVKLDPAAVTGSAAPEHYKTLPQEAGLLQLVEEGALTRNSRGEFLIQRKIRFPAELNGAHSVRFLLLRGVETPDGDPGHSCVIVEATGEPLKGGTCR